MHISKLWIHRITWVAFVHLFDKPTIFKLVNLCMCKIYVWIFREEVGKERSYLVEPWNSLTLIVTGFRFYFTDDGRDLHFFPGLCVRYSVGARGGIRQPVERRKVRFPGESHGTAGVGAAGVSVRLSKWPRERFVFEAEKRRTWLPEWFFSEPGRKFQKLLQQWQAWKYRLQAMKTDGLGEYNMIRCLTLLLNLICILYFSRRSYLLVWVLLNSLKY